MLRRQRERFRAILPERASPDRALRRSHQVMQENEPRAAGARSLLVILDASGRDRRFQRRALEPVVQQLPDGEGKRAQELDHIPLTERAELPPQAEERHQLAER